MKAALTLFVLSSLAFPVQALNISLGPPILSPTGSALRIGPNGARIEIAKDRFLLDGQLDVAGQRVHVGQTENFEPLTTHQMLDPTATGRSTRNPGSGAGACRKPCPARQVC